MLCAVTVLFTVPAFASDDINKSAQGTVGENFWFTVEAPNGQKVEGCSLISGSLPGGLSLGTNDISVVVSGAPSTAGSYSFSVSFHTSEVDYKANISITIKDKSVKTFTGSVKATQGKALSETELCDVGQMIQEYTVKSGKMPAGMKLTQYDTYFTVSGTPTESGTFSLNIYCQTEGDPCNVVINITVDPGELKITKNPGGETVKEGENASFVSVAEGYSDVEWRVVTKDGNKCWRESKSFHEIESGFPGVKVTTFTDNGKEWLSLTNIPASMDGYYIETKFWSTDKSKTAFTASGGCLLTVKKTELKAPTISANPESASKTVGEALTLSVKASDPNGGTLSYQWYSNSVNSNSGGTPITGATGTSLNVPQTEGTIYYYVGVASKKDNTTGPAAFSSAAAVTYTAAAKPSATPAPTATPAPATATPAPTPVPAPEAEREAAPTKKGGSFLKIILIVLILLLAAAAAALIIVNQKEKKAKAAALAAQGWRCPTCGKRNRGRFCPDCGTAKPRGELQYVCDKCGWTPDDPAHPPRFCPECGDPFGDEDLV